MRALYAHLDAGDPLVGVHGAPRAVGAHVVLDHELHHERLLQDGAVEHLRLRSAWTPVSAIVILPCLRPHCSAVPRRAVDLCAMQQGTKETEAPASLERVCSCAIKLRIVGSFSLNRNLLIGYR